MLDLIKRLLPSRSPSFPIRKVTAEPPENEIPDEDFEIIEGIEVVKDPYLSDSRVIIRDNNDGPLEFGTLIGFARDCHNIPVVRIDGEKGIRLCMASLLPDDPHIRRMLDGLSPAVQFDLVGKIKVFQGVLRHHELKKLRSR